MRFCLIYILLSISLYTKGQSYRETDLEKLAEKLFHRGPDPGADFESIFESLLFYHSNPLDLNKVSVEQLASLNVLNPGQLNQFINYRQQFGPFISIYELQSIPEFTLKTVSELTPFVTVKSLQDTRPLAQRIREEESGYFFLRYIRSLEIPNDKKRYQGSPANTTGRFRISRPHDFSIGFLFEKDQWEPFRVSPKNKQYGFDFYSAHFSLENVSKKIKHLIVGDYQLQLGQGLLSGAGFNLGKGAETINSVKRNNLGIRPYSSSSETGFFRGTACTFKASAFEITPFISYLRQDAIWSDDNYTDGPGYRITNNGLHRSIDERSSKNTIGEFSTGITAKHQVNDHFYYGLAGLYTKYSKPIQKQNRVHNQFEFQGDRNGIASVFANYLWQNMLLFGEGAISSSGGAGGVAGILTTLSPIIDFSFLIRNYDKNFHSLYGKAFGENSRNINEMGTYWGIKATPGRKYEFTAYFDRFRFPWIKYRVDAPSDGYEYLGRFTYTPDKNTTLYLQYRKNEKQTNLTDANSSFSLPETISKENMAFSIDYQISKNITLKTRAQGSVVKKLSGHSRGFALIQMAAWSHKQLRISSGFALFDTDNFENRQYVFEKDLLYTFSIPAYNGSGSRFYVLAQRQFTRKLTIYLKYASFRYIDTYKSKPELRILVRYKLNQKAPHH